MSPNFPLSCLFLALALLAFGPSGRADDLVNANEAVVLSDDIYKRTTEVIHAGERGAVSEGEGENPPSGGGAPKGGNNQNRSGLGDGTNPGMGGGRSKSPNEGTLNPNQARR